MPLIYDLNPTIAHNGGNVPDGNYKAYRRPPKKVTSAQVRFQKKLLIGAARPAGGVSTIPSRTRLLWAVSCSIINNQGPLSGPIKGLHVRISRKAERGYASFLPTPQRKGGGPCGSRYPHRFLLTRWEVLLIHFQHLTPYPPLSSTPHTPPLLQSGPSSLKILQQCRDRNCFLGDEWPHSE